MVSILDWAYAKALSGVVGVDSAYRLGDNYLKTQGTLDQQVDRLIKWQITNAATGGFMTGLGGFAMMPFSIPANVAGVIYIQIRMITAIAYMGGHDIESDRVKSLVYLSMIGNGAKEILKDLGIKAGEKLLTSVAQNASLKTLTLINEKVGTNVVSSFSNKGLAKLGKAIPLMGGVVGGLFDGITTKMVGAAAKKIFIDEGSIKGNSTKSGEALFRSVQ
ncbi:MAG: hypothetical protein RL662_1698 [Bacteroidota bacterium]